MPSSRKNSQLAREDRSGLIAGIAAFATWGLIPVYWKLLSNLPALEILAHRFVWTTVFLTGLLSFQQRWPEVREATRSRRALLYCFASGLSISVNWLFFIWAVNVGRVIETSLGYFMTPLVNVLFGALFLRERLTRWQLASVLLALVGVLNLTLGYGKFPWLALTLCISFGLYGRTVAKKIRRAPDSRPLSRNDVAHSTCSRLPDLPRGCGPFDAQFRVLVVRPAPHQHRRCDGIADGLVRPCRASSPPNDRRLSPIPVAQLQFLSRRLSVSRTIYPRALGHLYLHLGRARDLYRRSHLALAVPAGRGRRCCSFPPIRALAPHGKGFCRFFCSRGPVGRVSGAFVAPDALRISRGPQGRGYRRSQSRR
jgi:uncharacterized membrane protein